LIAECPDYIKSVVKLTIDTGMRRGEILKLTWGMIDLKEWGIRLTPEICKTKEGRFVPLNLALVEMFKAMPRGLPGVSVFTHKGKPITGSTIRVGFEIACKRAGIENLTFHDLRHTFVQYAPSWGA
jgi:integrase